ncbi:MAG: EpsI family protein [Gemmataceae bacterium]|nr:EpsI family protein [Gemmataceae bacterium]
MMKHGLQLVSVAALIAVSGYVHGVWTDRWSVSQELQAAVGRLGRVAPTIGDWQSQPLEMDPRQRDRAGVVGYLFRNYQHARTGKSVLVLVACGRPGPLSVHTPEICYVGAGYTMADPARYTSPAAGRPGTDFWTARFTKAGDLVPSRLRLYWSWCGSEGWQAPDSPRRQFAGLGWLYKLYVIQELTHSDERVDEEVCRAFLQQLLPELDRALRPEG